MSDYDSVHAPYNFVPFSEQVILRYDNAAGLPRHDRIEPGLKNGEIHITITAETPILVAVQNSEKQANFCRNASGSYILPGATIRGMTRTNIHILGFGTVIPGEDMKSIQSRRCFSDGLPVRHHELSSLRFPLDYPRAMFGYAGEKESYRSRISFEDLVVQGQNPPPEPPVKTVPGQPRPGWYLGYVVDGKNYTTSDFRLRGYKKYWMKKDLSKTRPGNNPNVIATYHPLPAGTVFRGKIRYKNLHEDELGLLLWALRLEKNFEGEPCYQSVGLGKPYGYGRIRLNIDELLEYDMEKLYSFDGLYAGPNGSKCSVDAVVSNYVKTYQNYALTWLQNDQDTHLSKAEEHVYDSILEYPEIQDFLFLHCIQNDFDTSYMSRWAYEDACTPLPDTASLRRGLCECQVDESEEKFQELLMEEREVFQLDRPEETSQDERSMDELLDTLKKHINSKKV